MLKTKSSEAKKTEKKELSTFQFILRIIAAVLFIFYVRNVIAQEINILRAKEKIEAQKLVYEETLQNHEYHKRMAENQDSREYVMKNARERLGLLLPGEIAIFDIKDKKNTLVRDELVEEENEDMLNLDSSEAP